MVAMGINCTFLVTQNTLAFWRLKFVSVNNSYWTPSRSKCSATQHVRLSNSGKDSWNGFLQKYFNRMTRKSCVCLLGSRETHSEQADQPAVILDYWEHPASKLSYAERKFLHYNSCKIVNKPTASSFHLFARGPAITETVLLWFSNYLSQTGKKKQIYFYLVQNNPVGINLCISLWIQHHCLIGPEVCQGDLCILRAHINPINHCILVKIRLADVTDSIAWMHWRNESRFMVQQVATSGWATGSECPRSR